MKLFALTLDDRPLLTVEAADQGGWWDFTEAAAAAGISAEDGFLGWLRATDKQRAGLVDEVRRCSVLPIQSPPPAEGFRAIPAPASTGAPGPSIAAPIRRPGKIMCIGRNYREHCEEQGAEIPSAPKLFSKWSSCVIGDGEVIEHPSVTDQLDYEGELVVVIGRTTRHATNENAMKAVFGYTIANDVTARDLQKSDGQWARAKGCEGFCPLGPAIITADKIPDPQSLTITTDVNGERRQEGGTDQMMFTVRDLIVFLSRAFTLEPGDLLLTGTPAGVGAHRTPPAFLRPGDSIAITVPEIGTLTNTVGPPSSATTSP